MTTGISPVVALQAPGASREAAEAAMATSHYPTDTTTEGPRSAQPAREDGARSAERSEGIAEAGVQPVSQHAEASSVVSRGSASIEPQSVKDGAATRATSRELSLECCITAIDRSGSRAITERDTCALGGALFLAATGPDRFVTLIGSDGETKFSDGPLPKDRDIRLTTKWLQSVFSKQLSPTAS